MFEGVKRNAQTAPSVRTVLTLAVVVCAGLSLVGVSVAKSSRAIGFAAQMSPSQVVPKPKSAPGSATGVFRATLSSAKNGYTITWRLTYGHLSGAATSAYVHLGNKGKHGPALLALCSPCKSGASGHAYFSPSELRLARAGGVYVNVRTLKNPAGEIRGQVVVSG
jgi:hypothetical protein